MGSGPTWAAGFYRDTARSGGALFDLHIHDTDFICWCFGKPASVYSTGDDLHITTAYRFDGPKAPVHIVAEGAWDLAPGAGFRMRFVVNFDGATAEFDLARTPALVLHTAEGTSAVEPMSVGIASGYDGQVRHLLRAIASGRTDTEATLDEAAIVSDVLAAEQSSLQQRITISLS
jgi:predicted dehydrogenase